MTGILDTNVVVRYLIDEPPDLADAATGIIETEEQLLLPSVVIAEVAHVLRSVYSVKRSDIADQLLDLIQRANVRALDLDRGVVIDALLMCRESGRVSFPDALVWAAARSSGIRVVYSLDRRFPSDGIEVRDAP
jgi:predicted nucleic acid-binding protein